MQLKRDTDYAIRILFCLKETIVSELSESQTGLTLSEIAANTGLARTTAGRICDSLVENGLIHVSGNDGSGEVTYYADQKMLKHSLLDVIEATESTGNIFAVFDRKSLMYKNCRKELERMQKKCEKVLSSTTLEKFLDKKGRKSSIH